MRLTVCIISLSLSLGSAQTVAQQSGDGVIHNAVEFTPGCKLPSAIHKPPDSPLNNVNADSAIARNFLVVDYTVTKDGMPVNIRVASGSISALEAEYVMRKMQEWKFSPAQCDGKIVAMKMRLRWEFTAPMEPTNPAIVGLRVGEMILNDSINDPSLEKLCIERASIKRVGFRPDDKPVPFEIATNYIALLRSNNSDATFVAFGDGFTGGLVVCSNLHSGTFGPWSGTTRGNFEWYWHLLPNPKYDPHGVQKAGDTCITIARAKLKSGFVTTSIFGSAGIPRVGTVIAGIKTEPYDIAVKGNAAYEAPGPDMDVAAFTCLFSPALELKIIDIQPSRFKK
jgi:hypothetical protein